MASFTKLQVQELASILGLSAEADPAEWLRFEDELNEVAAAYVGSVSSADGLPSSISPKEARDYLRKLPGDARQLAINVSFLLGSPEALKALGRAKCWEATATIQKIRTELLEFADFCEIASVDQIFPHGRGRPKSDGRFTVAVCFLARIWERQKGAFPGTRLDRETERHTGPFVDFVRNALGFLDPKIPKRRALGESVYQALQELKDP